jgi:hypothetical protein
MHRDTRIAILGPRLLSGIHLTEEQIAQLRHVLTTCKIYNREIKRILGSSANDVYFRNRLYMKDADFIPQIISELDHAWTRVYVRPISPRPGGNRYGVDTTMLKMVLVNCAAGNINPSDRVKDRVGIPRNFDDWDRVVSYSKENLEFVWLEYIHDNQMLNSLFKILINMWKNSKMQFENIPDFILNNSDQDAYTYLMNHLSPDLIHELFSVRPQLEIMIEVFDRFRRYKLRKRIFNM